MVVWSGKTGLRFLRRLDEAARGRHRPRMPFGEGRLIREAAPARPETAGWTIPGGAATGS